MKMLYFFDVKLFLYRSLPIAVLCLSLAPHGLCETHDSSEQQQRHKTIMSFRSSPYGVPLVQVRLDNGAMATFAIDTGSNYNVMADAMARKLKLLPQPYPSKEEPFQFDGHPAQSVMVTRTQVGELSFAKLTFLL